VWRMASQAFHSNRMKVPAEKGPKGSKGNIVKSINQSSI